MKQFGHVAGNRRPQDDDEQVDPITVKIVDREITFSFPGTGQLASMGAALGLDGGLQMAGAVINFFTSMIEDDMEKNYIGQLLLAPPSRSQFDVFDMGDVIEHLIATWGERPTEPASDSPRTQGSTGKPSTANSRRAKSTRSASRSDDS